jgi:hypothetical protein
MIITKRRNSAAAWQVYFEELGPTANLYLDKTNALNIDSTLMNGVAPSSSVITLGTNSNVNGTAGTFVSYCFNQVVGFSKFGSFAGNASADGPFIYCGFRPRFVIIKRTDAAAAWVMFDTARSSANVMALTLFAHANTAETVATTTLIDAVSNGFKLRASSTITNPSGGTCIYMAFAENPFKYSLAR